MKKNKLKLNQAYQRQSCDHPRIVYDSNAGEQLCRICGVVLVEKMVDFVSEFHSTEYQNSRVGPKSTLKVHDRGLSTDIGKSNKDASGNPVSYQMKGHLRRIRFWDSRSKQTGSSRRNLKKALLEMDKLSEKMSLSDSIIERASYFYRKISDRGLIRGRSVNATVGACVHAACRELGTNRTLSEISKNLNERQKNISKTYRACFQNLEIDVPVADITKIIVRFSNDLGINEKTKRDALSIFKKLEKIRLVSGKKPNAVAATVIYMAIIRNKEDISQQKISKVSGITPVTIRNRYQEFNKFINMII